MSALLLTCEDVHARSLTTQIMFGNDRKQTKNGTTTIKIEWQIENLKQMFY